MNLRFALPSSARAVALRVGVGDVTAARPRAHLTVRTAQTIAAVAIAPMVAVTMSLALMSDHLARPVAAGLYWSYLVAATIGVGLYWWVRRPASRFGPLLVAFGALAWVISWQASDTPLAFDIGVLAEAPLFVLTFYLRDDADRVVTGARDADPGRVADLTRGP